MAGEQQGAREGEQGVREGNEGRPAVRAITWNLYHGRDFPPDPALLTWRSRLFRTTERNRTHAQVNRELLAEFVSILSSAEWDVALLQECPPRWTDALARACGAGIHVSLTSRNSLARLRWTLARLNPDLIASNEGGSNATLSRGAPIVERDEAVLRPGPRPERRTVALTRLQTGLAVANLHATTQAAALAAEDVLAAAEHATAWAGRSPLLFGGDLNVRPEWRPGLFETLAKRFGLTPPGEQGAIDHLLARGLDVLEPAASWPPERREVSLGGLAVRLSDHPPVSATFRVRGRSGVYSAAGR